MNTTLGRPGSLGVVSFLEGPAALADGRVFVSDIRANRIYCWTAERQLEVFRDDAGRANGNIVTAAGLLYTCEGGEMGPGGRRRIVRTDLATGSTDVLADTYEGKRFNSPNDLTVDAEGVVYFTDPRYGSDRSDLELDVEGVYRIGLDGAITRILGQDHVQRPNGIALSPDGRTLYVVDSHPAVGGNRLILAVPLASDGTVGEPRTVFDFGRARGGDGLKVDQENRLYVCAGIFQPRSEGETDEVPPGVYVLHDDGSVVGHYPVPHDLITNCCFGGDDGRSLFITAGQSVFTVHVDVPGLLH
ncbi:SMP-30/gluconolactonase/LRE family protein [Saccharomonospora sp. NPDC046836]|uniref:SMP-30/gluconolactonase/LRE family protein n=1 Tax=Saccharomonospora sp. NPDC046836 TaxID=3156921 RepID=UPI0033DB677D